MGARETDSGLTEQLGGDHPSVIALALWFGGVEDHKRTASGQERNRDLLRPTSAQLWSISLPTLRCGMHLALSQAAPAAAGFHFACRRRDR